MKFISSLVGLTFCFTLSVCMADSPSSPVHTSKNLSVQCGEARITIQCNPKSANCTQTTLRLDKPGTSLNLVKPRGITPYTAVGLACTQAKDGTPYVVVQYGELPSGCQFCEWYHLYTMQGKLLTQSDPAVLVDRTLPNGKNQRPNNKTFNALSKKLGIEFPEIEFLE